MASRRRVWLRSPKWRLHTTNTYKEQQLWRHIGIILEQPLPHLVNKDRIELELVFILYLCAWCVYAYDLDHDDEQIIFSFAIYYVFIYFFDMFVWDHEQNLHYILILYVTGK